MVEADEPGADYPAALAPAAAALKRVLSSLSGDLLEVFSQLHVTIPQFRVLRAIRKGARVSGRQLARELNVSPGAIVQLCDRLEEQRYVERVPDTNDRRVTWFQLTATARALFDEILAVRRSKLAPALARLSETDVETLTRILGELADALETERRTEPGEAVALQELPARSAQPS